MEDVEDFPVGLSSIRSIRRRSVYSTSTSMNTMRRGGQFRLQLTSSISALIKSSGARLSQIEEGCPLRDVTCADDTDKVVKVLFSIETAEVGFYF